MSEGLKQTIERAEEMMIIVPTSITTMVESDLRRLIDAALRVDAIEAERDALRAECDEWRENYAALEAVALASERARHAVPVEAIRSVIDALVEGRFEDTAGGAALVCMWLDAQRQAVQP